MHYELHVQSRQGFMRVLTRKSNLVRVCSRKVRQSLCVFLNFLYYFSFNLKLVPTNLTVTHNNYYSCITHYSLQKKSREFFFFKYINCTK